MTDYSAELCILLLQKKYTELNSERFPKKDDFSPEEVVAIKAFLGPWPRALEKAKLKAGNTEKQEKKQKKRIAAKRKATLEKIERQKTRD